MPDNKKKIIILHPFLLILYPALFLYNHNIGKISLSELMITSLFCLILTSLLFIILLIFLRNLLKVGFLCSLFIMIFFSYGHILKYLKLVSSVRFLNNDFYNYQFFSIIIFIFIPILIIYFVCKTTYRLQNANYLLNIISTFLLALVFINILTKLNIFKLKQAVIEKAVKNETNELLSSKANPNIYYIILDAYARDDVLNELFSYDNKNFLTFLKEKDFYIVDKSSSNYMQTSLSLASSLNLRYLEILNDRLDVESFDYNPMYKMINNNEVFRFLQKRGYKIVIFSSGHKETEIKSADVYLNSGWSLSEFQNLIINTTPIPYFLNKLKLHFPFDQYRENIQFILNYLPKTKKMNSPIFVLVHIFLPHPPFIFDKNGKALNPDPAYLHDDGNWLIKEGRMDLKEYQAKYQDQLTFLNNKLKELIISLLSNADNDPIIILQADHGSRSELNWEDINKSNLKECLSILNAYYVPIKHQKIFYSELYPTITPVNSFRILFNNIFNTNFNLLEDKNYFSTAKFPYKFIDVTKKIIDN